MAYRPALVLLVACWLQAVPTNAKPCPANPRCELQGRLLWDFALCRGGSRIEEQQTDSMVLPDAQNGSRREGKLSLLPPDLQHNGVHGEPAVGMLRDPLLSLPRSALKMGLLPKL